MAHSREIRLPFLDHELVKFLFQLPADLKIREGWTKYIMRKAFESVLPLEITWRKDKIGYEPPQREWMNNGEVRNAVRNAAVILVEQGVLHRGWLGRQSGLLGRQSGVPKGGIGNGDVHPGGDMDWRFLMAAGLFS
jgi:asparagine synthase (glutamine-hydrolysing)